MFRSVKNYTIFLAIVSVGVIVLNSWLAEITAVALINKLLGCCCAALGICQVARFILNSYSSLWVFSLAMLNSLLYGYEA